VITPGSDESAARFDDLREETQELVWQRHRHAANRAIVVSAVGLALTGAIELAIALLTGSVALLGDALHNLSDVSTSAVVFLGFAVSRKPPTRTHPYGYERAEDLAGLGVPLVILASAVFAGYQHTDQCRGHAHADVAGAAVGHELFVTL
jgi:cation diffusion facilitator family transporter